MLSSLYLSWTVVASFIAEQNFQSALRAQNIVHEKLYVTPAPFNSLLWRAVVIDELGYYEAYYSVLDGSAEIPFTHYPSDRQLLAGIADHWPVQRLQWFSHDIYSVKRLQDDIVISDLRMGVEPHFAGLKCQGHPCRAGVEGRVTILLAIVSEMPPTEEEDQQ